MLVTSKNPDNGISLANTQHRVRIFVHIYRRDRIGRDGTWRDDHLDKSEAHHISKHVQEYGPSRHVTTC